MFPLLGHMAFKLSYKCLLVPPFWASSTTYRSLSLRWMGGLGADEPSVRPFIWRGPVVVGCFPIQEEVKWLEEGGAADICCWAFLVTTVLRFCFNMEAIISWLYWDSIEVMGAGCCLEAVWGATWTVWKWAIGTVATYFCAFYWAVDCTRL